MIKWLNRKKAESEASEPENKFKFTKQSADLQKHTGLNVDGSNADYHYSARYEIYAQAEYARDLDRNNVLVSHTVDRLVRNVVQGGFEPEPSTGRKTLDARLKEKWERWAKSPMACDIQRQLMFCELTH